MADFLEHGAGVEEAGLCRRGIVVQPVDEQGRVESEALFELALFRCCEFDACEVGGVIMDVRELYICARYVFWRNGTIIIMVIIIAVFIIAPDGKNYSLSSESLVLRGVVVVFFIHVKCIGCMILQIGCYLLALVPALMYTTFEFCRQADRTPCGYFLILIR